MTAFLVVYTIIVVGYIAADRALGGTTPMFAVSGLVFLALGFSWLVVWRLVTVFRNPPDTFRGGYIEGRTAGMTDEQFEAYMNKPPVAARHHGKISMAMIGLILLTLPVSWPVAGLLIVRSIYRPKRVQEAMREYERTGVYPD